MEATLHMKDGSTPKFIKARPVPFAIKPKLEKALDKLERQGSLPKQHTVNGQLQSSQYSRSQVTFEFVENSRSALIQS